jgi:hypothetical protein
VAMAEDAEVEEAPLVADPEGWEAANGNFPIPSF